MIKINLIINMKTKSTVRIVYQNKTYNLYINIQC